MLKSAREAKLHTSWINPDAEYEAALERFVTESMASALFVKELDEAMPRLAHLGMLVGLSQALVKVASPGVPDYYQGTELWDFSLVDPDNRRPVDYALRIKLLNAQPATPAELLAHLAGGRAELPLIRRGLGLAQPPARAARAAPGRVAAHATLSAMQRRALRRLMAIGVLPLPEARAQQSEKVWRIGFLYGGSRQSARDTGRYQAFIQGMRALGYAENKN